MGIILDASGESGLEKITCVICNKEILLAEATAGLLDNDNQQAFACNAHFYHSTHFILGWVDFAARERFKLYSSYNAMNLTDCGDGNAWLVS